MYDYLAKPTRTAVALEQVRNGILQASGKGDKLNPAVQRRLERSLGADLSNVRVHTDNLADRLASSVAAMAFTSGSDIFFRSGRYDPDSPEGLRLLAHEAAHVVQQASGVAPIGPVSPRISLSIGSSNSPYELAADCAAQRVMSGIPASRDAQSGDSAALGETPQVLVQRHASWEHRLLGDARPVDLNAIAKKMSNRKQLLQTELQFLELWKNNPDVTPQQIKAVYPDIRTVTLEKSQMVVTYGELNTLPDYMANPTVLDAQPRNILLPILQAVRQEGYNRINGLLGHSSPTSFKDAVSINTGWSFIDLLLETKAIDDLTWDLGPNHTNHYLALVARNACHFAPFSWYRWEEYYTIARNLARQAYQELDSASKKQLTYDAWMNHGYADHFVQDSFAAGHLVNKTLVMQWFLEFAVSGVTGDWWARTWIADWNKVKNVTAAQQPGLAGRQLYNPSNPGSTRDPQTAEEQPALRQRMNVSGVRPSGPINQTTAYQDYLAFLDSTVCQAASGVLHDHFNANSLWVTSPSHATPYQIWGDDTMLNGGDGVEIAGETAQMSQQSILDILGSGQSSITAQQIRDRLPNTAADTQSAPQQALEQWNDSQKNLAMTDLFYKVHYYLMSARPRIGYVSQDQGAIPATSTIHFKGSDGSYAEVKNSSTIGTPTQITVEVQIRADSFNPGNWQDAIVSKHGERQGWEIRVGEAIPRMMVTINGVHYYAQPSDPSTARKLQPGLWYYLTGTFDGQTISLYENGYLQYSTRISGPITQYSGSLMFGKNANPAWNQRWFKGAVNDIRLWDRALSEAEIRANMGKPLSGTEPGLIGYWPANEGSGNTLNDRTSHHDNAMVVAGNWVPMYATT